MANKIKGEGNSFSFKDLEEFTVEKQNLKLASLYETITNKIKEENELNIDLKQKHTGSALKL